MVKRRGMGVQMRGEMIKGRHTEEAIDNTCEQQNAFNEMISSNNKVKMAKRDLNCNQSSFGEKMTVIKEILFFFTSNPSSITNPAPSATGQEPKRMN